MMKTLITIAAVIAAVLGTLVADQAPVSAHQACQVHDEQDGPGRGDRACVSPNHKVVTVCDGEKDGNRVEAWIWTPSGVTAYRDKDGSKGGCSEYELARPAHRLALCENREGCTNYINV
jgi:hypothetical protein